MQAVTERFTSRRRWRGDLFDLGRQLVSLVGALGVNLRSNAVLVTSQHMLAFGVDSRSLERTPSKPSSYDAIVVLVVD